jgi:F-type H+-transporting ATPase subunit delta
MSTPIAERYARAILELGVETNQLEALTRQISHVARAYAESADLRTVLDNPLVDVPKREAILAELGKRLSLSPLALSSIRLLAERHRLVALPDIARRLGSLSDEKAGILRATVISAAPLPDSYYTKLTERLAKATGKKIVLDKQLDPSLIAGVVTRIGDNTIDGSIKGRLAELERRLLRAS